MTDGWYKPAIADYAATDGGSFTGPVTVGVLHTTESPEGRYRSGGPNNYGRFGHTFFPHFTVAVVNGVFQVWQHISIRRAAKAMKNAPGGVQTNREGVVQIEVVGSATKPFTRDAVMVEGLSALMRWIESQTEIPAKSSVDFIAYPASYGLQAKQRMTYSEWTSYAGWCGHQHVPENDHGDPGAIDIKALLPASIKPATTAAPKPAPAPSPSEEEDEMKFYLVADPTSQDDYGTNGVTKFAFPSQAVKNEWAKQFGATRITLSKEALDAIPTVKGI